MGFGFTEVIPLGEVDPHVQDNFLDRFVVDELGDGLGPEFFGKDGDRLGYDLGALVILQSFDQGAIYLDKIDVEVDEVLEVGVTASKIVNSNFATQGLNLLEKGLDLVIPFKSFLFQDLYDKTFRST